MPLYEYQCPKDGTFEQVRKFSDPPLVACPTCGGPIEKLVSAPAIQFKGTGWYITDYARKSPGDGGKEGKEGKESKDKGAAKESSKEGAASSSSETKSSTSDPKSSSGSGEKKK